MFSCHGEYNLTDGAGAPYFLEEHFLEFEERYDEFFQKKYGFYRPVISHVVNKYLQCGDLNQGLDVSQVRFIG